MTHLFKAQPENWTTNPGRLRLICYDLCYAVHEITLMWTHIKHANVQLLIISSPVALLHPFTPYFSTPPQLKAPIILRVLLGRFWCKLAWYIFFSFYARLQNWERWLLASSCRRPSFRPHGTIRLLLDGFWRNLIFELFRKSNPTIITGTLHEDVFTFMTVSP